MIDLNREFQIHCRERKKSICQETLFEIREILKSIVESDKWSFSPQNLLFLHWDSKIMHNIVGGVEVCRIAVFVTRGEIEKLLAFLAVKKYCTGTSNRMLPNSWRLAAEITSAWHLLWQDCFYYGVQSGCTFFDWEEYR